MTMPLAGIEGAGREVQFEEHRLEPFERTGQGVSRQFRRQAWYGSLCFDCSGQQRGCCHSKERSSTLRSDPPGRARSAADTRIRRALGSRPQSITADVATARASSSEFILRPTAALAAPGSGSLLTVVDVL